MSETNETSDRKRGNTPVDSAHDGAIRSAIFQNEGEKGPFFTATLEKRWQDGKGDWHSTTNFNENEVLRASEVLRTAHQKMIGLRHEQSHMREAESQAPEKDSRREQFQDKRRQVDQPRSRSR